MPTMSASPSAMISSSAMAWTMPGGIGACRISARFEPGACFDSLRMRTLEFLTLSLSKGEFSKRLQQPIQIIAFRLRPVHLRRAAAQLLQNLARFRQIGGARDFHARSAQR